MIVRRTCVALALAATLVSAHAASAVPLIEPERVILVATEGSADADAVKKSIVRAGAGLGWIVTDDRPGKLTLKYNKQGKHEVVIDAHYDAKGYELKYVGSTNMKFSDDDGTRKIHPNYNRWIANLIKHVGLAFHGTQAAGAQ